jgi:hypothetical protein
MAYSQMSLQVMQIVFIEDLRNQAQTFVDMGSFSVAGGYAGGLLASMLQGVNGKIGQPGNVHPRGTDSKDAACFAG